MTKRAYVFGGPTKGLHFGILCRVSTTGQEDGESLARQEDGLRALAASLGATVAAAYIGQETGRADIEERRLMSALLRDVQDSKLDAVAVRDLSRWARNNAESKRAMKVMLAHGVRFFIGGQEYDLASAHQRLALGVLGEIAEGAASANIAASIDSKRALAKRGIFMGGRPPYGRIPDGIAPDGSQRWKTDEDAKRFVEDACKVVIDKRLGLRRAAAFMSKRDGVKYHAETLRDRVLKSGSIWMQQITDDKYSGTGYREEYPTTVPALLSEERIAEFRQVLASRSRRGRLSNDGAPLRKRLRCGQCGSVLSVFRRIDRLYITHQKNLGYKACFRETPPYEPLEADFFYVLGGLLRDEAALRLAAEAYYTKRDSRVDEVREQHESASRALANARREHGNLIRRIAQLESPDGPTAKAINAEITRLDRLLPELEEGLLQAQAALATTERPTGLDQMVSEMLETLRGAGSHTTTRWTLANKQAWAAALFGTETLKYKTDLGVYVRVLPGKILVWEAAGRFGAFGGTTANGEELSDTYHYEGARIDGETVLRALPLMAVQKIGRGVTLGTRGRGSSRGLHMSDQRTASSVTTPVSWHR